MKTTNQKKEAAAPANVRPASVSKTDNTERADAKHQANGELEPQTRGFFPQIQKRLEVVVQHIQLALFFSSEAQIFFSGATPGFFTVMVLMAFSFLVAGSGGF